MKIKVKKSDLKEYYNIITISYCNGQNLLYYKEPTYYTSGVYGWCQDSYVIDYNTIISTGYNPINSAYNTYSNYEITKEYDTKAKKILLSNTDTDTKKKKIDKLIIKYVEEMKATKKH